MKKRRFWSKFSDTAPLRQLFNPNFATLLGLMYLIEIIHIKNFESIISLTPNKKPLTHLMLDAFKTKGG
jgi:hypothetical protein